MTFSGGEVTARAFFAVDSPTSRGMVTLDTGKLATDHLLFCLRCSPTLEGLMAVLSLSAGEALALATRTEDELFDRKSAKVDGRGLQKIAVAFANANGGEVTVGIADSKEEPEASKRWSGLAEPEEFNGLLQALFSLNPFVEFRYEFCQSE